MARRVITLAWLLACAAAFTVRAALGLPLLAQNWRDLSPRERYDAMQNYRQHEQLPPDRQQDMERRYEQWRNLPPDERARVRQNYERFRQMPPQERERFERKYEKWRRHTQPPQ
jgi:hypothetical protein